MSGETFDVLVVGAGHAGCEAAHAAARMGRKTAILSGDLSAIARMSCNPAIGGLAKGQLVKEVDALGGLMGRLADAAGIQFKILNRSRGPAVWGPRAQCDKALYSRLAAQALFDTPNLRLVEGMAESFLEDGGRIAGVVTGDGTRLAARAVIVTTGTFLRGLMHTGQRRTPRSVFPRRWRERASRSGASRPAHLHESRATPWTTISASRSAGTILPSRSPSAPSRCLRVRRSAG